MAADNEFAQRIARIEAKAKTGRHTTAVMAPLVGEEDIQQPKRRSGMAKLVLTLAAFAVAGGVLASQLMTLLPPELVRSSDLLSTIAAMADPQARSDTGAGL